MGVLEQTVGAQEWVGAKEAAVRLRYLEGIGAAAKRKLENLED